MSQLLCGVAQAVLPRSSLPQKHSRPYSAPQYAKPAHWLAQTSSVRPSSAYALPLSDRPGRLVTSV